ACGPGRATERPDRHTGLRGDWWTLSISGSNPPCSVHMNYTPSGSAPEGQKVGNPSLSQSVPTGARSAHKPMAKKAYSAAPVGTHARLEVSRLAQKAATARAFRVASRVARTSGSGSDTHASRGSRSATTPRHRP